MPQIFPGEQADDPLVKRRGNLLWLPGYWQVLLPGLFPD